MNLIVELPALLAHGQQLTGARVGPAMLLGVGLLMLGLFLLVLAWVVARRSAE